jgi:hypothetical protein
MAEEIMGCSHLLEPRKFLLKMGHRLRLVSCQKRREIQTVLSRHGKTPWTKFPAGSCFIPFVSSPSPCGSRSHIIHKLSVHVARAGDQVGARERYRHELGFDETVQRLGELQIGHFVLAQGILAQLTCTSKSNLVACTFCPRQKPTEHIPAPTQPIDAKF